ncbi:MAG: hypothetical protein ACYDHM_11450 [Acidiferrobacterales bacterium]
MSISGISTDSSAAVQNSIQGQFQQRRADFQQLGQSLGSGNLAGAQQAFSTLLTLMQSQSGGSNNGSVPAAGGNSSPVAGGNGSPLSAELAQIGQALQSGDLSSAQQGYATLMQQMHGLGHGHHHHGGSPQGVQSAQILSAVGSNGDGDSDGSSTVNVMA